MDFEEAITLTQDRLAEEAGTMGELLGRFRDEISPILIGDREWKRILECADKLPPTIGAFPFGFELPLHESRPDADFGVSLASGTRTAAFFEQRARTGEPDESANAIARLFREMDAENSILRQIVGRKLMLEYDIGSARESDHSQPGMFLRPAERPVIAGGSQLDDVGIVIDALVSAVGWKRNDAERENVERVYLAQQGNSSMDSFGVFPSRDRAIRLAVMGFGTQREICSFLENAGWPGQILAIDSVISRFRERVNIVSMGAHIDVREEGVGPTLGLTLLVKQRISKDTRYWLDDLNDWDSFLQALGHEDLVVPEKLAALAGWASKPTTLFAKSGRYILLRGIHHIKLTITGNQLPKAKAYVYMVLTGASFP